MHEVKAMIGDGAAKLVERAILATGGDLTRLSAIGRRFLEIYEAHAAGVRAFAVTYGYSHRPHAELGADRFLDSMPELLPIIAGTVVA
jgi:phosphoglycolate phosphatase-like HAD superfamily hydrolase